VGRWHRVGLVAVSTPLVDLEQVARIGRQYYSKIICVIQILESAA
jgi:hypothetical protein